LRQISSVADRGGAVSAKLRQLLIRIGRTFLELCTEEVKDKLRSNVNWDMHNNAEDLMETYLILETIRLTRGALAKYLTLSWSDYIYQVQDVVLKMDNKLIVTKTFD